MLEGSALSEASPRPNFHVGEGGRGMVQQVHEHKQHHALTEADIYDTSHMGSALSKASPRPNHHHRHHDHAPVAASAGEHTPLPAPLEGERTFAPHYHDRDATRDPTNNARSSASARRNRDAPAPHPPTHQHVHPRVLDGRAPVQGEERGDRHLRQRVGVESEVPLSPLPAEVDWRGPSSVPFLLTPQPHHPHPHRAPVEGGLGAVSFLPGQERELSFLPPQRGGQHARDATHVTPNPKPAH